MYLKAFTCAVIIFDNNDEYLNLRNFPLYLFFEAEKPQAFTQQYKYFNPVHASRFKNSQKVTVVELSFPHNSSYYLCSFVHLMVFKMNVLSDKVSEFVDIHSIGSNCSVRIRGQLIRRSTVQKKLFAQVIVKREMY